MPYASLAICVLYRACSSRDRHCLRVMVSITTSLCAWCPAGCCCCCAAMMCRWNVPLEGSVFIVFTLDLSVMVKSCVPSLSCSCLGAVARPVSIRLRGILAACGSSGRSSPTAPRFGTGEATKRDSKPLDKALEAVDRIAGGGNKGKGSWLIFGRS